MRKLTFLFVLFLLLGYSVQAQSTAFTYQGYLTDSSGGITDTCNFQFSMYDAASSGSQIGSTQAVSSVTVDEGRFATQLDFGSNAFDGSLRYLEIAVQCTGDGSFTTLAPRQTLSPSPCSIYSSSAPWSGLTGVPPGFADDIDDIGDDWNSLSNIPSGFADGIDNVGTGTPGWALTGNAGTTPGTNFIGTTDDVALEFHVNGIRGLRIEPATNLNATTINVIGGYSGNTVGSDVVGATIFGGGQALDGSNLYPNTVLGDYSTISGGELNTVSSNLGTIGGGFGNTVSVTIGTIGGGGDNTASGGGSTIGGGERNTALSLYSTLGGGYYNMVTGYVSTIAGGAANVIFDDYGVIAGGDGNRAGSDDSDATTAPYASVGGGGGNISGGELSTVGGGYTNQAGGLASTVPGGALNQALGEMSFAAGRQAIADDNGAFVWSDSRDTDVNSPGTDTFNVSAQGGIWLGTGTSPSITSGRFIDTDTGAYLTTGGAWTNSSDRNSKTNFEAVDTQAVLEQVIAMPITTWNYLAEGEYVQHMGPMAQDFQAAFSLGADETSISTIDADGMALAAIQGLYDVVQEKDSQIVALQRYVVIIGGVALIALLGMAYLLIDRRRGQVQAA